MTRSKPSITRTTNTLPFDKLSPRDFERLCLWLVEREGYERAEHLGAAGSEQGRDIVAWRGDKCWAFQCKRVRSFGPRNALAEVEKVLALLEDQRPAGLVFLVTCDVSSNTRQQARDRCAGQMECHFWGGTELDLKVCQQSDIVAKFFGLTSTIAALRKLFPEGEPAFEQLVESIHELTECHQTLCEWKDLHHILQRCLGTLRTFMTEVELAYNNVVGWDSKRGKRLWSPFRVRVGELRLFAERVQHISALPLYEDDAVLRGEPWAVEIIRAEYDVEEFLDDYDIGELHGCTLRLLEACDIHLNFADGRLRDVAARLSAILSGTLRSIS